MAKRYKIAVIKFISPGDVMYSLMTIDNKTIWYI